MRKFSFVDFVTAATVTFIVVFINAPAKSAGPAYLKNGSQGVCTLTDPCSTMASAIAAAGSGGEVICLDKGRYGFGPGLSITTSITISCGDGLWEQSGSTIGVSTPANAVVVIEGLIADGTASVGSIIPFTGQGTLHLRRVRIGNSIQNNTNGAQAHGVEFSPTGPASLIVSDSTFYNMGTAATISAGIRIKPASGVTANVMIERSSIENNNFGIIVDGTGGGIVRGGMKDSYVTKNRNNGITVSTGGNTSVLTIDNTFVTGNGFGLAVAGGSNAGMLVRRSTITANATGLFSSGGAVLLSYGDNAVNANTTTDGAFTGTVGLR